MARLLQLEDFAPAGPDLAEAFAPPPAVLGEEQRLAAFEEGYRAGWDDAAAAQSEEQTQISSDFAGNLRDLAFTFHEARGHVLAGIRPLIEDVVAKLLPEIARQSLPHLVSEELSAMLEQGADKPVRLLVAAGDRAAIEAIVPGEVGFPLQIVEEPSLAQGQVWLRLGERESAIDVSGAVEAIAARIADFFSLSEPADEPERAHG